MKNYFLSSFSLSLLLTVGLFQIEGKIMGYDILPITLFFPGILFFLFLGSFSVLSRTARKDPKRFITYFMGVTGGKMLLALFFVLGLVLVFGKSIKISAVVFIGSYLLFMALETIFMVRYLRTTQKGDK